MEEERPREGIEGRVTNLLESLQLMSPQRGHGTFSGVYVPSIVATFGVIIFLRLGWISAMAGLWQTLLMFLIAYLVFTFSVLSIGAIASNGTAQTGGAYYLVSRSLGPEFGGSIGFLFFFANILATSFYIFGFEEILIHSFGFLPATYWWKFLYGSVLLLFLLFVLLIGSKVFLRLALLVFLFLFVVLTFSMVCFLVQDKDEVNIKGFTGPSLDTLQDNWNADYTVDGNEDKNYNFQVVFSILFPGLIGLIGAPMNMIGSIKDPTLIPRGTFLAMLTNAAVYLSLAFIMMLTTTKAALADHRLIIYDVSLVKQLVSVGVLLAVVSAASSSLGQGPNLLRAIGRDKLIPLMSLFGHGQKRCIVFSYLCAQVALLLPGIDAVAPYITMFALVSYLSINFACFFLTVIGAPNWRPRFKYFHWSTALVGVVLCTFLMFFINPFTSAISIASLTLLFFYIHFMAPVVAWGNVSQALIYSQVRKYLLMLDVRKQHVKYWRPQVLLLVGNARSSLSLIHIANTMKKGGLYIIGNVVVGDWSDSLERHKQLNDNWMSFIDTTRIEAFPQTMVAPTAALGIQSLIQTSGISGMKPNTVIIGFHEEPSSPAHHFPRETLNDAVNSLLDNFPSLRDGASPLKSTEYVSLVVNTLRSGRNVLIARHFHKLIVGSRDKRRFVARSETVEENPVDSSSSSVSTSRKTKKTAKTTLPSSSSSSSSSSKTKATASVSLEDIRIEIGQNQLIVMAPGTDEEQPPPLPQEEEEIDEQLSELRDVEDSDRLGRISRLKRRLQFWWETLGVEPGGLEWKGVHRGSLPLSSIKSGHLPPHVVRGLNEVAESGRGIVIDVWPLAFLDDESDAATFTVSLLFSYIVATSSLSKGGYWVKNTRLRVCSYVSSAELIPQEEARMRKSLEMARITCDQIRVVPLLQRHTDGARLDKKKDVEDVADELEKASVDVVDESVVTVQESLDWGSLSHLEHCRLVNLSLRSYSSDADLIFLPMPKPPESEELAKEFLNCLSVLTNDLPPVMLCRGVTSVITTEL